MRGGREGRGEGGGNTAAMPWSHLMKQSTTLGSARAGVDRPLHFLGRLWAWRGSRRRRVVVVAAVVLYAYAHSFTVAPAAGADERTREGAPRGRIPRSAAATRRCRMCRISGVQARAWA